MACSDFEPVKYHVEADGSATIRPTDLAEDIGLENLAVSDHDLALCVTVFDHRCEDDLFSAVESFIQQRQGFFMSSWP